MNNINNIRFLGNIFEFKQESKMITQDDKSEVKIKTSNKISVVMWALIYNNVI